MSLFVKKVVDEWGVSYNPTTLGYTVIVLFMLVLLLLSCSLFGKKKRFDAKTLAFCAVSIALSTVLSLIQLFPMPFGGSVTLCSMLFITVVGYWFGLGPGLMTAVAYGLLQLIINPYIISIPQMLLDYVFAFGALGLSGFFHKSKGKYALIWGYLVAILGRLFFTWLSGVVFFGYCAADYGFKSVPLYSLLYNGAYIFAEGGITIAFLFIPPIRKAFIKLCPVDNNNSKKEIQ